MKGLILLILGAAVGISAFPWDDRVYERTELGNAIDRASLKFLNEAYKASDSHNVVASPLGILILLSLYSEGAGELGKGQIQKLLGVEQKNDQTSYSALSHEFANMDPKFITLANKIYIQNGHQLNEAFTDKSKNYKSEVENINFGDAAAAAATINKWSDEKTLGHIKDPVSADAISADTVAGLFNVIFFQGHWHVPFNASNTKDEDFYITKDNKVKKPTMHLEQSLFYTESEALGAKMVELPYKEPGFRMVIVLPNEIDGLASVLQKASEKGLLEDVFKMSPSGRDVNLHLPKFDIKTKHDLNNLLPKVGVDKIFSEAAPGIVKDDSVSVSKAFQEAFVKIDEEGATAGAFTGLLIVAESLDLTEPQPLEFRVDRPFLFLILHEDKILFSGTYSN